MLPYQINEGHLRVPAHWRDQSMNIFQIPAANGAQDASFIISRDANIGDDGFTAYIERQVAQCQQSLPQFALLNRHQFSEPMSYAWLDYTWENGGRRIMLRQLFFEHSPCHIIATLTLRPEDAGIHEPAWREVLRSIKLEAFA